MNLQPPLSRFWARCTCGVWIVYARDEEELIKCWTTLKLITFKWVFKDCCYLHVCTLHTCSLHKTLTLKLLKGGGGICCPPSILFFASTFKLWTVETSNFVTFLIIAVFAPELPPPPTTNIILGSNNSRVKNAVESEIYFLHYNQ